MGPMGSLGEELVRAMAKIGLMPARKIRLHDVADTAVRSHGIGAAAVAAVNDAVEEDPALLLELLDEIKFRDALVRRFLEGRAAALRAQGVTVPAGQRKDETRLILARRDKETRGGSPAKTSAGQNGADSHLGPARRGSEVPAADGHTSVDIQSHSAVRLPGHAKRGASSIAAVQATVRRGLLDTIMVNGQKLRDVTVEEALGASERMALNATLISRICNGLDPRKLVGEQVSDDEAERRAKVAA